MHGEGRVTLIARDLTKPDVDWNPRRTNEPSRVAFVKSVTSLRYALDAAVTDSGLDIGRVIVDRSGTADEFLDLLTALPAQFAGDVLLIRDNGTGVMSATGRGGDRVLYALRPCDIRFYLEAHDLVIARVTLEPAA